MWARREPAGSYREEAGQIVLLFVLFARGHKAPDRPTDDGTSRPTLDSNHFQVSSPWVQVESLFHSSRLRVVVPKNNRGKLLKKEKVVEWKLPRPNYSLKLSKSESESESQTQI